jgi:prenylcysteine lyase
MTDKLLTLYDPDAKSWSSIEELNNALNWTDLTSQAGSEYFQSHGVSQTFTNEFVEGVTRVNYAQVRRTPCSPRFRPLISLPCRVLTVFMDWKPRALLRQMTAVASGEGTGKFLSNL